MLGIHRWGLHRPDRREPKPPASRIAPRALLPSPVVAIGAIIVVGVLAATPQPQMQALILALAGVTLLLGHRGISTSMNVVAGSLPGPGWRLASAATAGSENVPLSARNRSLPAAATDAPARNDRWTNSNVAPDRHGEVLQTERLPVSRFAPDATGAPHSSYAILKRSFDLVAAVLVTLVMLPLLPIIALAIRIDSPGAVFYTQDRVGQDGRLFRIYKFRTMRTDAERHGAVWAMEDDPRVTRAGNVMRRSRLDELPQLLNVFRGEMTFVGPRPERPEFTRVLERELPGYGHRHSVKPGLTGWAQIRYQYASSIQDTETKLAYDLYYVKHRSLRFDTRILIQTIPVVLHLQGR